MITTPQLSKISHLVQVRTPRNQQTFYGLNIDEKPRILAFPEFNHASNCASFICDFKAKYNSLPPMDLKSKVYPLTTDTSRYQVSVVQEKTEDLVQYCCMFGVHVLCVVDFDAEIEHGETNIDFKAFPINTDSPEMYVKHLDSLLSD